MKSSAWKVVAASLVAGEVLAPVLLAAQSRPPLAPDQVGPLVVLVLGVVAWLLISVWTWRLVGRMRKSDGRDVFRLRMLGWGLTMGLAMTAMRAVREAGESDVLSWGFAARMLTYALMFVLFFMFFGSLFGRVVRAMLYPSRRDR